MTEYILDCEFVPGNPLLPISLALVQVAPVPPPSGGGNCCYNPPCNRDRQWADWERTGGVRSLYVEWPNAKELAVSNDWLKANVLPGLTGQTTQDIPARIRELLGPKGDYELLASYGAYDFFLLSETLGGFASSGLPYTYREMAHMNLPRVERQGEKDHNALDDCLLLRRALLESRRPGGNREERGRNEYQQ